MLTAALWLSSFLDRDRRRGGASVTAAPSSSTTANAAAARGVRTPRTHVDHGANVAHFFSTYPWLAWPLVVLAVLIFLALLPLRIFGSMPWYVKLGTIATLGTGFFLWWRKRKQTQVQQQQMAGQPYGYYPPPQARPPSFEPEDDPNWRGHV